jgi:hypothetical protein
MYPPVLDFWAVALYCALTPPLVNAANKHSVALVRKSHSLSLLRNGQVLEDAERLIAGGNKQRQ